MSCYHHSKCNVWVTTETGVIADLTRICTCWVATPLNLLDARTPAISVAFTLTDADRDFLRVQGIVPDEEGA